MTFHTALRQLKPSLITAHLLQQRGILVMWFNKYFCIQRSTYLMSLTAEGNSHLLAKIKKPNLHAIRTHIMMHTPTWQKQNHAHNHKRALSHAQVEKTRHSLALSPHTGTHRNNLFSKKTQEQMTQMKGAKLREGMCLHSLTTFWRCYQGANQTNRLL